MKRTKFAALLIGLAVVGAACASDTANQTTVPAPDTTTTAAPTASHDGDNTTTTVTAHDDHGDDADHEPAADADRVIEVTLSEFAISGVGPIVELSPVMCGCRPGYRMDACCLAFDCVQVRSGFLHR